MPEFTVEQGHLLRGWVDRFRDRFTSSVYQPLARAAGLSAMPERIKEVHDQLVDLENAISEGIAQRSNNGVFQVEASFVPLIYGQGNTTKSFIFFKHPLYSWTISVTIARGANYEECLSLRRSWISMISSNSIARIPMR